MRPFLALVAIVGLLAVSFPSQGAHGGAHVEPFLTGLLEPVHAAFDGVDPDLMYVSERAGRVLVYDLSTGDLVRDALGQPKAFLDVRGAAGSWFQEMGLLSIAFHPDHAENGFVYVGWVDQAQGSHVTRFTRSTVDPQTLDLASVSEVLSLQQPFFNHNGGLVLFGPDGLLYAGFGDGGLADDPLDTGQDPSDLFGSILRLDVDSVASGYAIPADNPWAGNERCGRLPAAASVEPRAPCPEVWAYGLRNPWRFSFDGSDLWVADVGQNEWEEVNVARGNPAPVNYGWKVREGAHDHLASAHTPPHAVTDPVTEYSHDEGCSVTGGYVYRGADPGLASLVGKYTFADYCSRRVFTWDPVDGRQTLVADSGADVSSMGLGPDGTQYVVALGLQSEPLGGWVGRLVG